jgi:RIO-like serine/threonine protein kinase
MVMTAARIHPLFNVLTSGSLFRQYRLLEQIGVGGEGVVWSALDQEHDQIHAIKFRRSRPAEAKRTI